MNESTSAVLNQPARPRGIRLAHVAAGLQAGVLGALVMLGCVMLGSLWDHRSVWLVPNLFATTFYGVNAYRDHLAHTSWAGAALVIVIYGTLGAAWGCVWRDSRRPRLGLYGAIAGLLVYFIAFQFVWKHVNGLVVLYAPDRQLEVGHLLWGMILAKSPEFARRIAGNEAVGTEPGDRRESTSQAAAGSEPGVPDVAAEFKSGEFIL